MLIIINYKRYQAAWFPSKLTKLFELIAKTVKLPYFTANFKLAALVDQSYSVTD